VVNQRANEEKRGKIRESSREHEETREKAFNCDVRGKHGGPSRALLTHSLRAKFRKGEKGG